MVGSCETQCVRNDSINRGIYEGRTRLAEWDGMVSLASKDLSNVFVDVDAATVTEGDHRSFLGPIY